MTETLHRIREIAKEWGVSYPTVRRLFRNEPGVVRMVQPGKRKGLTLVPDHVKQRVYTRMTKAPYDAEPLSPTSQALPASAQGAQAPQVRMPYMGRGVTGRRPVAPQPAHYQLARRRSNIKIVGGRRTAAE